MSKPTDKNGRMKRCGSVLTLLGLLCLFVAAGFAGYNFLDDRRAAQSTASVLPQLIEAQDKTRLADAPSGTPAYEFSEDIMMPVLAVNGNTYCGTLDIPALKLSLPVLDSLAPALLKVSPCRWQGTAYKKNMIIAAHNYRSHFGYLKNLSVGDKVIFTDMDGNCFTYEVGEIEWIDSSDFDGMTSGGWELTLFTCTVGGGARVTVRCEKAK